MAIPRTQTEVIDNMMTSSYKKLRGLENENVDVIIGAYRKAQDDIIETVNRVIRQVVEPGGTWSLQDMTRMGRDKYLFNAINGQIDALGQTVTSNIEYSWTQNYLNSSLQTAYMIDQATPNGINASLPVLPVPAIRALANEPFEGAMFSQRIGVINDAMASDIRDGLLQSMINGESMDEAGMRIADILGASNLDDPTSYASRADMIARTEIMRAQNLGREAVYDDNADIMADSPEWLTTPDDRLCPSCFRRDGKTAEEIAKLPAGKDPWGKKATAPLHPRCRCTIKPRLKTWRDMGIDMPEGDEDEVRGMRNEETGKWTIQPVEKYDAWYQRRASEFGFSSTDLAVPGQ